LGDNFTLFVTDIRVICYETKDFCIESSIEPSVENAANNKIVFKQFMAIPLIKGTF
jgi:hypothetical protein